VVFEGSGFVCPGFVWAWDGNGCAETTHCLCDSGECDRVYQTALECLAGNAECIGPDPLPDPSCEPTVFEDTGNDCLVESYVWNGTQCTRVSHCGCASGDCDRLYADYKGCEIAHAACLPDACQGQDARSNGTMCGTTVGYAFNGAACKEVICGCSGTACDAIEDVTLEQCESTWALCLARVPECIPTRFPVETNELGYDATYPEYTFTVEGYPELYDAQSQTVAVFSDWTAAVWGGWQTVATESEFCGSIDGVFYPTVATCPQPKQLVLQAGAQTFRVNVTLHWPSVDTLAAPTNVEVRIVAHPSGSLVLQVRDAATDLLVVMVVQTLPGATAVDAPWELAPFTFTQGEELCRTLPGTCGWSFSALGLAVSAAGVDESVEPLYYKNVDTGGVTYTVYHGAFFNRTDVSDHACSAPYAPRRNFAVFAKSPSP